MLRFLQRPWLEYLLGAAIGTLFMLGMLGGLPKFRNEGPIRISTALLPPQMKQDGSGREAEIIGAALKAGNIDRPIEFHIHPFTRHWQSFKSDSRYHAVSTVPDDLDLDGPRSAVYIRYQNGVIYRVATFPDGLGASPTDALRKRRIVAFAGAATILPEVRILSSDSTMYLERQDQFSHSVMLANNIVDAVIAEELIFSFYMKSLTATADSRSVGRIAFDPIFCPTRYRMVFRDDKLRDAFNIGFQRIRDNGLLKTLEDRYSEDTELVKVPRRREGC